MSCLNKAIDEGMDTLNAAQSQVKTRVHRENPFKDSLEKEGIVFPSKSGNCHETASAAKTFDNELYLTAPRSKREEDEQLKFVLSLSTETRKEQRADRNSENDLNVGKPINEAQSQSSQNCTYRVDPIASELISLMEGPQSDSELFPELAEEDDDREVANLLLSLGGNKI